MSKSAVYALVDPRTDKIRYIGTSSRPSGRLYQHKYRPSPMVSAWIEELRSIGFDPFMRLLGPGTEDEWIQKEKPDLNRHKRGNGKKFEDPRSSFARAEGAGRPPSTLSSMVTPVQFRVSAAQREELELEGARIGVSANEVAKRRCFAL